MDFNNGLRGTSASGSAESPLGSQLLGAHAIGVTLSDSDGGGTPVYENGLAVSSGRRTSRVWKYFRMVDNCHYECCLCSFVGAYTNTTNMRKHIQNHHPEIFQDILDHTRPSNRLHYLRPFQPQLFSNHSSVAQYQQSFMNSNHSLQIGSTISSSNHAITTLNSTFNNSNNNAAVNHAHEPYADTDQLNGSGGEEGDSAPPVSHPSFGSQRESFWEKSTEPHKSPPQPKFANTLYKTDTKPDVSFQNFGDDRKLDSGGLMSGIYPPGLSEASTGSGDNAGCDDVSVPLSPEQFLSEETEQGGSPHTPTVQRPESYKLRHNNHLTLVLESLAGDESFMDVTLTAQGKAIKAHKSVLSAVSPYFRSVLKENPCQHPIIIMPRDIRFEELNNIISYVYKGEMTVAAEDLSSLLKTAEILQVTGLSPSDTGSGSGGIMSQMQGLPASMYPSSLPKRSSKQKHQAQQQQHYQQQQQHQQEQLRHAQRQQQEQMDQDDQPMNDDVSDAHERVDPLEFLNTDMTCVKEEIESDNDDGEDSSLPLSVDASGSNNISEPLAISDSSNSSSTRRKSTTGSPKPLEDITSKPFNPGEPGVSSAADESFSESVPSSVPYMCPHCLEVQRPLDILQSHLRLKHPTKPSFVCPCGRVFGRQSLLAEHARKCKF